MLGAFSPFSLALGGAPGVANPLAGVTKDATSGVYRPANATEWASVLAAAGIASGGPSSLWLMQEASGNLADSIGALALTAGGTGLAYQQAVSGWASKAVTFTDAGSGHFSVAATVGPNPTTTSSLWIAYVDLMSTPATVRDIMSAGGAASATQICAQLTTAGKLRGKDLTLTADGTGNPITPGVIPIVLQFDRTHSVALVRDDAETVLPTFGAGVTDGAKGFGATQATSAAMAMVYGAMFQGAAAEVTAAQIKTLLTTLSNGFWTIA